MTSNKKRSPIADLVDAAARREGLRLPVSDEEIVAAERGPLGPESSPLPRTLAEPPPFGGAWVPKFQLRARSFVDEGTVEQLARPDPMPETDRPPCPACKGTRVMGNKHPRPCTCCDDGTMRGVTDETAEERRIAELERCLAQAKRRARMVAKAARQRRRELDAIYKRRVAKGLRLAADPWPLLESSSATDNAAAVGDSSPGSFLGESSSGRQEQGVSLKDGTMRGVTDETAEERRIADLDGRLRLALGSLATLATWSGRGDPDIRAMQDYAQESLTAIAASDSRGGGR